MLTYVEDNAGMLHGESCLVPVCIICGCRNLYERKDGWLSLLDKCPDCGNSTAFDELIRSEIEKECDCIGDDDF